VSTTAADWFKYEADFRQLCGDAVSQSKGESAQEFAADMMRKVNEFGLRTYLTPKQLQYLCRLADHNLPVPVRNRP